MEDNKTIVPVVLAADHFYAMPLGVTITSILANKKQGHIFKIYIIDGGLDINDKQKLEIFNQDEVSIEYLKVNTEDFRLLPEKRHITMAGYYRLIAPKLINYEKIIYLDSDIIVNMDLIDLYNINLRDQVIAAVSDISENYIKKYFFRPISKYFNSGVLLINVKKWREQNIWEKATDFIKQNSDKFKFVDQDTLNHLLEYKWLEIDNSFNFQLNKHHAWDSHAKINILHFIGSRKPWHYLYGNKYKKYFLDYLRISPWRGYKYPDKNFKSFSTRYLLEPIFLFFKKIIKKTMPQSILKVLKNILWYLSDLRDSR